MLVSASRVITPDRVLAPGWIRVEGETITGIGPGRPGQPVDHALDGATVVPGFVDTHVHGGGGAAFDTGTTADAETVLDTHLAHGTTTMLASLVTLAPGDLDLALDRLAPLVDADRLAGFHLEGPWLSPAHAGAHDPALLEAPSAERVEAVVERAAGRLRMVTLAPELDGGLDAVRRLVAAGVVVAIGHTDATYDETRAALDAGARVGTHLFNAMRGPHHREPGPATALLDHPGAHVELIADGVHLHPAVLRRSIAAKSRHAVLVTDAMAAAGARDGDYRLGPLTVRVHDQVARLLEPDGHVGAVAGSTLTLAAAVRYAVRTAEVPLVDAVRAATATPAALHGLDRVGRLRTGARADLVALDNTLGVRRVMRRGRWVRDQLP